MRVLFVTPVEAGAGETVTALHMAENIVERGGNVLFLASAFARRLIGQQFPEAIRGLTDDGEQNRALWKAALFEFRPDVVVFADYPLLFFSGGVVPLVDKEWVRSLDDVEACLVTLDHTGFAQREIGLFFGPPHLSFHYQTFPAIPARMHLLLPCPMNEPAPVAGRRGEPFRYWDVPLRAPDEQRRAVRRRYLDHEDDVLVFHATARWAWQTAQANNIPYYQFLPEILVCYLADLPKPVTLVSVNNGQLLQPPAGSPLRIVNLASLPTAEYEALLFASDLMITENRISITLGKAICGGLPCAVLRNSFRYRALLHRLEEPLREMVITMESLRPGAIYPYDIFPSGMRDELEQLGLYRDNSLTQGFQDLEVYGGEATRQILRDLLIDEAARAALRAKQQRYVDRLRRLDDAELVLRRLIRHERGDA
ncbi:MAG: DUF6365 family protein [Ardenticatenaceae bacterium]|nr:DUF6365 family protein [Ardenticatenaceae bacterium]